MRMFLAALTLALFSLAWASPAAADGQALVNGGFETGDFTGWTLSGNTTDPFYGVDGLVPNSGNFGAFFGVEGSPVTISQDFTAALGQTVVISFFLDPGAGGFPGEVDTFEAILNGTSLLSIDAVNDPNPPLPGYTEYSFTLNASQTNNTIAFSFQNDDDYWNFDDASVAVPEPSSLLMLATALPGLLFFRRRKAVQL